MVAPRDTANTGDGKQCCPCSFVLDCNCDPMGGKAWGSTHSYKRFSDSCQICVAYDTAEIAKCSAKFGLDFYRLVSEPIYNIVSVENTLINVYAL